MNSMTKMKSTARVKTEMAGRYMRQMCSHFAHKLPAESEGDSGSIQFPVGLCLLNATHDVFVLTLETETSEDLTRLQDVIAKHLVRFAWREELNVVWEP
jgi:uncharacterized protein